MLTSNSRNPMRYFTKDELRSLFVMDDANYRCRANGFRVLFQDFYALCSATCVGMNSIHKRKEGGVEGSSIDVELQQHRASLQARQYKAPSHYNRVLV